MSPEINPLFIKCKLIKAGFKKVKVGLHTFLGEKDLVQWPVGIVHGPPNLYHWNQTKPIER